MSVEVVNVIATGCEVNFTDSYDGKVYIGLVLGIDNGDFAYENVKAHVAWKDGRVTWVLRDKLVLVSNMVTW